MRFLIAPNDLRPDAVAFAAALCRQIRDAGHTPLVMAATAATAGWHGEAAVWDGADTPDMLLVAGGDGTLLKYTREIARWEMPVWGVNFGHMGYLAECEPAEAAEAVSRILAGDYVTEDRILLQGRILSAAGDEKGSFIAVNEANIYRAAFARALHLEVTVDGHLVRTLTADGLIVSTPTGSTAYNFSAGGPILLPGMRCFAITPVCPYAALSCAIVADGDDTISVRVRLPQTEPSDAPLLIADGCERFALCDGDEIRLCRAAPVLRTVKTRQQDFYARLQQKLARG